MAPKRKKPRKKQKAKLALKTSSGSDLLTHGQRLLDVRKPKDAIAILKMAKQKNAPSELTEQLLFRAYSMRANQLRDKGLAAEAQAVFRQAQSLAPPIDRMAEEDLLVLAPFMPLAEIVDHYASYVEKAVCWPRLERYIAGTLMVERHWHLLDSLPAKTPLQLHAGAAKQAALLMHSGSWQAAADALKSVPRTSAYAPARWFCGAMTAFYAEDHDRMRRALAMVPPDFPLFDLACKLQQAPQELPCLWKNSPDSEKSLLRLIEALEARRVKDIVAWIRRAADLIWPAAPQFMRLHLLELIFAVAGNGNLSPRQLKQLVSKTLDSQTAELFFAIIAFFSFSTPLMDLYNYLKHLKHLFPDPRHQTMAQAQLMLYTLEKMQAQSGGGWTSPHHLDVIRSFLGLEAETMAETLIEINLKALGYDPTDRAGYERLASWPRPSRMAKKLVEDGLLQMCQQFGDDPYPCLELATLYYEKNAFRKAERILAQAMHRAPHDRRVENRHVLSLLISAHKSLQRGKLQLAARDIDRAAQLGGAAVRFIIVEQQILYQIEQQGQLSLFDSQTAVITPNKARTVIEHRLAPLSDVERLRTLGLLVLDCNDRHAKWPPKVIREVVKILRGQVRRIKSLSSAQVVGLFSPLPREFAPLTGARPLVGIYVTHARKLLRFVDNAEIFSLLDILAAAQLFDPALEEIKRRLPKASVRRQVLLRFYQTALQQMAAGHHLDTEPFRALLTQADEVTEELRMAARRLARCTTGALEKALASFCFDRPVFCDDDDFPLFPGLLDNDLSFDDDEDDRDPETPSLNNLSDLMALMQDLQSMPEFSGILEQDLLQQQIVDLIESYIDENNLRGAPAEVIYNFRRIHIRQKNNLIEPILTLGELLSPVNVQQLSTEAWTFFFGKG